MKKILLASAIALTMGLSAAAQSADELRIYINPGHGSWTPDDRPCTIVGHGAYSRTNTDTLSFFESNTNLRKGFGVLEKLREFGLKYDATLNQEGERWQIGAARDMSNNIVMSHVKCGPYNEDNGTANQFANEGKTAPADLNYYNRSLSEIAAEVDANNFDMFISIHSNAATEGTNTNYPLFLYRGYDDCQVPSGVSFGTDNQAQSREMAEKCWPYQYGNEHQVWTYYSMTNMNLRGDVSFYGSGSTSSLTGAYGYLGVIKHNTPGFLVEGYFHTYQPARHRAMNFDVDYLEGYGYARGIADYFGLTKDGKGDIYGIIRDAHERFTHQYYTPNAGSDDKYLPINGATVTLKKGGEVVASVVTDEYYNGAYVFKDLEPGEYTLEFSHPDYKAIDPVTVTVTADACVYPSNSLENVDYVPPTEVYENYPDPTAGLDGFHLFPSYDMEAADAAQLVDLEGKTVRRQLYKNGIVYILALDADNEPYIYAIKDGVVTELDKAAIVMSPNGTLKLSDIALTAEGVLVGCGYSRNHFDDSWTVTDDYTNVRGYTYFYKWTVNEETGLPETCEKFFETNHSANWYRAAVGRTLAYSGTLEEGTAYTTAPSGYYDSPTGMRLLSFSIADGALLSTTMLNAYNYAPAINHVSILDSDNNYELNISPLSDGNFVIDGDLVSPIEVNGTSLEVYGSNDLAAAAAIGANYFKFAEHSLMVTPDVADGKVCGLKLFDITNGFNNAVEIATNTAIEPVDYTYASAHGSLALTLDATDTPTDASIILSLIVDGKLYQWTEKVVKTVTPAAGSANPFAYGLYSAMNGLTFEAHFKLNADAEDVNILFYDENNEVVYTKELGAQSSSEEIVASIEDVTAVLEDGNYTWAVSVEGAEKSAPETFKSYRYYHPRGVDVDNSMESPYFGNVYCTEGIASSNALYHACTANGGLGLYAFDAKLDPITNPATDLYSFTGGWTLDQHAGTSNGADFARVRVAADGRIFVTRCNDDGDFILCAKDFGTLLNENKFESLLAGYTYDADNYIYNDANGNYITGVNIGFDIQGSGEDLKLLVHSSDKAQFAFVYNASTDIFNLGNGAVLADPINIPALSKKYTISPSSVNVAFDDRGGVWYCQYRSAPTNEQPALVYVDAEGVERYKDFEVRGGGGIRFSPDYKYLAISNTVSSTRVVTIYSVDFDAEGTPYLQEKMTFAHGIGTNVNDIAWDLAGNIYVCGNSGEYLKAFALPRTEPFITTAPSSYTFNVSAVDGVQVAEEDAPAEYYNLQGVKVSADNLTPGIYIRKVGKKVDKILVK